MPRYLAVAPCALWLVACSGPSPDHAADEAAIRAVIAEAMEAHDTGDAARWSALAAPAFAPKAGGPAVQVDWKELIIFRRQPDGAWKAARIMVNHNRQHTTG